jgi:hypothetical protein
VHARAGAVAALAGGSLGSSLQSTPVACSARNLRRQIDSFRCSFGCLHKGDAGLHLDVIADKDLLLKGVRPCSTTSPEWPLLPGESREDILKVEAASEAALAAAEAAAKWVPSPAKRIASWGSVGVEASCAELIVLFLLLWVG